MEKKSNRSAWSWIPTLYFAEGLPYVVAMTVAVIMYKRMGISNIDIALYTSWLYLPWVIKPFWSPFVDIIKTKRWWVLSMQLLIGAGLAGVAFLIPVEFFFQASLAVLWLIAFSSATHDIAADGFYMLALDESKQSFFVGIRSTFYRFAMITGQGLLIILAGALESKTGLEPIQFSVESSQTSINYQAKEAFSTKSTNELAFCVYPSNLIISTQAINADTLSRVTDSIATSNIKNGFVSPKHIGLSTVSEDASWWMIYVSKPLTKFLKTQFGQKEKPKNLLRKGNIGIVSIKLNKKPTGEKPIILVLAFKKGDKSISIISDERLVFTSENWNKTAYVVVQLDSKLNYDTKAVFVGSSGNIPLAWSITFFIIAGFFIMLAVYHRYSIPIVAADSKKEVYSAGGVWKNFLISFKTFFQKKELLLAILFMLIYRLGEALLVKMATPFLLDSREIGGLGLTTGQVGFVYGTVGVISLTLGGIVGGIAASRKGLKFWLWPMALSITLPHLAFLYLSWFMPESIFLINAAVAVEQFGYGFGFTAYMLYLIYFSDGEHKTSHYAMCTGFMALGMMLPGMIAGWLQEILGYNHFFIFVMICAIPTLAIIPFIKVDKDFGKKS